MTVPAAGSFTMKNIFYGLAVLLQTTQALAAPSSPSLDVLSVRDLDTRRPKPPVYHDDGDETSCRGAQNRSCWLDGFDINTDYEAVVPYTGRTRKYTLELTEIDNWLGPDGQIKKKAMLINGGFPGPTIEADWGDMVEVKVINNLRVNGSSIHWHGVRMLNNAVNDGVGGVTECPIPPGSSRKYHFLAEQYGSSWYHSHFSVQVANGPIGAMKFNGPASRNFDVDLGVLQIADWYWDGADEIGERLSKAVIAPPPSDNVLFNGKHVGPNGQGGEYARMTLVPGKRHRISLVNPSVDNAFIVSLVNHNFTILSTDFVPVQPTHTVDSVFLAIGQRVDVTIEADQAIDNYWFNVTMDASGLCGLTRSVRPAMIFGYEGANSDNALPTNPGVVPPSTGCTDLIGLEPIVSRTAPASEFDASADNQLDITLVAGNSTVHWNIHGSDINITWDEPTLEYVAKGNLDFPRNYNLIHTPDENEWTFWLVQNLSPIPHPMHLHGHDFLIIGRNDPVPNPFNVTVATFNSTYAFQEERDSALLDFVNPTRRDVTMLQSWGWVVLAYETNNPGAWLMHCHIAWHISQGLGIQFLERVSEIPSTLTLAELQPTCKNWEKYQAKVNPYKFDSGL